jgi:hypothetical protein
LSDKPVLGAVESANFEMERLEKGEGFFMGMRIYAVMFKEVEICGKTIQIDAPRRVDVTWAVLGMSLTRIKRLKDRSSSSGALVQEILRGDSWPYLVEVTGQVCAYFEVSNLSEITKSMLQKARTLGRSGRRVVIWLFPKSKGKCLPIG